MSEVTYSCREIGVHLSGGKAVAGPVVITAVSFENEPIIDYEFARFLLYKKKFTWDKAPSFLDALSSIEPQVSSHVITVHELNHLGESAAIARGFEYLMAKYCFKHKIKPTAVRLYSRVLEGSFNYPCFRVPNSTKVQWSFKDYLGFTAYVVCESRRRRVMSRLNKLLPQWNLTQHWGKGLTAKEEVWLYGPDPYIHRMHAVYRFPTQWERAVTNAMLGVSRLPAFMTYDWIRHPPKWWNNYFSCEFTDQLQKGRIRKLDETIKAITKDVRCNIPPPSWEPGISYSAQEIKEIIRVGGLRRYSVLDQMRRAQSRLYRARKVAQLEQEESQGKESTNEVYGREI